MALSPDGTRLALATLDDGTTKLFLRSMEQLDARSMEGTDGASLPFFSPDGEWIGFFAGDKLKKASVAGGAPVTVCDARNGLYASWGPDDRIYFSADSTGRGVSWVSAAGGTPQAATTPNEGEWMHWPLEVLPDGKAVLITVWTQAASSFIGVLSLETGEYRALIESTTLARYAPTGHLIYEDFQTGALLAVPFDLGRLEVTGPPVVVVQGLRDAWLAVFALSENGNLVYVPGSGTKERTFVWVNRHGEIQPVADVPNHYEDFRISPDGQRVATGILREKFGVWVYDMPRGTLSRLTFAAGHNGAPIWTPDGRRVTFASERDGRWNLYWKPADGSGQTERLTESEDIQIPQSWSPDGRVLAFMTIGDKGQDIWLLPIDGERKPEPFLDTPFSEQNAEFSPDGRWIAYVSDETGRPEVYVTPYPGPGGKFLISKDGGVEPLWAPDGTEIFYRTRTTLGAGRSDHKVMVVPVRLAPEFSSGKPQTLFEDRFEVGGVTYLRNYDIASDGQRFLMLRGESAPTELVVVLNWFEELKRIVPE